jgi:hypothetical protein
MSESKETIFTSINAFVGTRTASGQQARVEEVRKAAQKFHETMSNGPKVAYFESFDLVKIPYASKYGLRNAFSLDWLVPYFHIQNRLFVVQFYCGERLKTMLVSPSDFERGEETPYFRRSAQTVPNFIQKVIVKRQETVPEIMERIGLRPEDIDYLTYDHLHTQDVRQWLGSHSEPGLFPNAKLIVHRKEWASAHDLNPYQRDWYCPDGLSGIPEDRVIQFDNDVMLGDGVALIHTPGHTEGNHSIVVHTDEGLWVTSENGISADAYEPAQSGLAGLAKYSQATGVEAIINGNTLENSVDQYISMIQEKTIAGPSKRDPRFPNIFPSSEMTAFALFPGTRPTMYVGKVKHGRLTLNNIVAASEHEKIKY